MKFKCAKTLIGLIGLYSLQAIAACPNINFRCEGKSYPLLLTFDDGPSAGTDKILNILQDEDVKAMFFTLGEKLIDPKDHKKSGSLSSHYYSLLKKMKQEGHLIGSHTYHHIHHVDHQTGYLQGEDHRQLEREMLKQSQIDWRKNIELTKNSKTLRSYLDNDGEIFFRLPYGQGWFEAERNSRTNTKVLQELLKNNSSSTTPVHIGWNIDSEDWKKQTNEQFLRGIRQQICQKEGGIILMHDHTALTQENLSCLIQLAKKAGHDFVDHPNQLKNERVNRRSPRMVMSYGDIKGVTEPNEKNCSTDEDSALDKIGDSLDKLIDHLRNKDEYIPFAQRVHQQDIYDYRQKDGSLMYKHLITFSNFSSIGEAAESKELKNWAEKQNLSLSELHFFKGKKGVQVGVIP